MTNIFGKNINKKMNDDKDLKMGELERKFDELCALEVLPEWGEIYYNLKRLSQNLRDKCDETVLYFDQEHKPFFKEGIKRVLSDLGDAKYSIEITSDFSPIDFFSQEEILALFKQKLSNSSFALLITMANPMLVDGEYNPFLNFVSQNFERITKDGSSVWTSSGYPKLHHAIVDNGRRIQYQYPHYPESEFTRVISLENCSQEMTNYLRGFYRDKTQITTREQLSKIKVLDFSKTIGEELVQDIQ